MSMEFYRIHKSALLICGTKHTGVGFLALLHWQFDAFAVISDSIPIVLSESEELAYTIVSTLNEDYYYY